MMKSWELALVVLLAAGPLTGPATAGDNASSTVVFYVH